MIIREENISAYKLERTRDRIAHVMALRAARLLAIVSLCVACLAVLNWSVWIIVAVLSGIAVQYLVEYCTHRFVYHVPAPAEVTGLFKWLYSSHWGHHDFPNNPNLWGGTSLWFAPCLSVVFFLIEWAILSLVGVSQPALMAAICVYLGSIPTYICYEWAHVTAHASGQKNWLERYITREHAKHHFQDFNANYHVNAGGIIVDHAFGTAFDKSAYRRSDHIRTMGLAPNDPRLIQLRKEFADDYNITDHDREKALA